MLSFKRQVQEHCNLEKQSNLLSEKINKLKTSLIIETDDLVIFKLEKQIKKDEKNLETYKQKLAYLENKLRKSHFSLIVVDRWTRTLRISSFETKNP